MTRRQFLLLIVPLLAILFGFTLLSVADRTRAENDVFWDEGFTRYVRDRVGSELVTGIPAERDQEVAYFNGLNAWLSTFDEHGEVTPPWELEDRKEQSSGQYAGIGIRPEPTGDEGPIQGLRIIGVKPGGPADQAGLRVGEEIVAVDGIPMPTLCPDRDPGPAQDRIRGEEGTAVVLTVRDEAGGERDVRVVRARIDSGSVFGTRMEDPEAGIGYVRIESFHVHTAVDFRARVSELLEEGMRALILDLRSNRGGLLPQAVEVVDAFLPRGVIVHVRGRRSEHTETHRATPPVAVPSDVPVAVLVNRHTASAAEVVAGALQDHRRALLVGERTWGKFKVQTVRERPTRAGSVLLKFTTSIYETPSGRAHQRRGRRTDDPLAGLRPDVRVPRTMEEIEELYRTTFREERFADWNPDRTPQRHEDDDVIEAALAILRGEVFYPEISASDG